jgi:acyl-CoA reductase-like NAD-dependent aldehyde dehydrogenase
MIEVVQAFDRTPIARLDSDDAAALDRKIEAARRLFSDRSAWLKPHQRIEILRNTAALMEGKRDHLGRQIAREGGKSLTDVLIETDRAIDGVRNTAEELRVMGASGRRCRATSDSSRSRNASQPLARNSAPLIREFV